MPDGVNRAHQRHNTKSQLESQQRVARTNQHPLKHGQYQHPLKHGQYKKSTGFALSGHFVLYFVLYCTLRSEKEHTIRRAWRHGAEQRFKHGLNQAQVINTNGVGAVAPDAVGTADQGGSLKT